MSNVILIILGAGQSPDGNQNYCLQELNDNKKVLDWQLKAFEEFNPEIIFVGGYEIDKIIKSYPDFKYCYNFEWQKTGSLKSLEIAVNSIDISRKFKLFISYSDIIFDNQILYKITKNSNEEIKFAYSNIEYFKTKKKKALDLVSVNNNKKTFVGLVSVDEKISKDFCKNILMNKSKNKKDHISQLFNGDIINKKFKVRPIRVDRLWAHAESSFSISRFLLSTKASTLSRLRLEIKEFNILDLIFASRTEFYKNRELIINNIIKHFPYENQIIVRSSAVNEDGFNNSNAGKYLTIQNINKNFDDLNKAIHRVFKSYQTCHIDDQVLVQPQLQNVKGSGVILSRTLNMGSPYYIINYELNSQTNVITSGFSKKNLKFIISRKAPKKDLNKLPNLVNKLISAVKEVQYIVRYDSLDLEFAFDKKDNIYLLQVRPLVVKDDFNDKSIDAIIYRNIESTAKFIRDFSKYKNSLLGDKCVWSNMADWNPAEIIGKTPNPLAIDLYRNLITDKLWSIQRFEVGYKDVSNVPLLRTFGGQPYIDVRASLNSFLPKDLDKKICIKIINYGLSKLIKYPFLHDKIEFSLLPTCFDFNFEKWEKEYTSNGILNNSELSQYKENLLSVTKNIIKAVDNESKKINEKKYKFSIYKYDDLKLSESLNDIFEKHIKGDALSFAHLARGGFVSACIINSLVEKNIITKKRRSELLRSIENVGTLFNNTAYKVKKNILDLSDFIDKFGHLRPGTYDITIPPYHKFPEKYIFPAIESSKEKIISKFSFNSQERFKIDNLLKEESFEINANQLLQFIVKSIEGREYSKLFFTKTLSEVLDKLTESAKFYGLDQNKYGSMPLNFWLNKNLETWSYQEDRNLLEELSNLRYSKYKISKYLNFPSVISDETSLYAFQVPETEPSFITDQVISANLLKMDSKVLINSKNLKGFIVAIENADPGYDFILSLNIAGLITAYGGPNSHMSIRASEFSIPAVIGIGKENFDKLKINFLTTIDCVNKKWYQEFEN